MKTASIEREALAAELWVDGTAEDGTYQGDAVHGPWVVFDIAAQEFIAGPFRWQWQAWREVRRILRRRKASQ